MRALLVALSRVYFSIGAAVCPIPPPPYKKDTAADRVVMFIEGTKERYHYDRIKEMLKDYPLLGTQGSKYVITCDNCPSAKTVDQCRAAAAVR